MAAPRTAAARTFELVSVDKLTAHPENPRRGDVASIVASIRANGFYGSVVVQRSTGHVLVGNHRLAAARQLGMDKVPVVWADVDDERARRILVVDNRSNDLAGWDEQALADMLAEMATTDDGLLGTGFGPDDLVDMQAALERAAQPRVSERSDRFTSTTPEQLERYQAAGVRYLMIEYEVEAFATVVEALDAYRAEHSLVDNAQALRMLLGV